MNSEEKVAILKSLADEIRLSLVRRVIERSEASSSDLIASCSRALELSQPTMSHHFNRLVQSGVLTERKSGTAKFYQVNRDLLTKAGIDPTKL